MNLHRETQWQLQLMQQRQNVEQLSERVNELMAALATRTEERDTARRIAMRLEEELAAADVVMVPVWGEAR